ncbi:DUF2085 domain-containing protein [Fusobacterium perfoetens]|uniref:DUF2085 domain-containing protein n=1 Tax=Fusobacterium perfoetens TaxID=852 RepID=UPI003AF320D6
MFLCWRCSMISFSSLLTYLLYIFEKIYIKNKILMCIFIFPVIVDGFLQFFKIKMSNNIKRALMGFLFGIGYISIYINFFLI